MTAHRGAWQTDVEIDIAATQRQVWAIVSDIRRHPALAGSGELLAVRMNGPLRIGATFESDVSTGEVGSFSPHCIIEDVDAPARLGWVSLFPLAPEETADDQIEVHWSFDLLSSSAGTRLRHAVHIPRPKRGADELAAFFERTDRLTTVRAGMLRTVENVKQEAERNSYTPQG